MDVLDFFSARGGGRGSLRRREGGRIGFLLKVPRGAVSPRREGREGGFGLRDRSHRKNSDRAIGCNVTNGLNAASEGDR